MRTQNNLLGIRISNDYGILENIFVSLDSEFEITVSLSVIRIKKNLGYLKDFFGENVTSVSGIVGPNGVGKTTLLNYIKSLFIQEKSELRYRENDIVFFKQGNKILIYLNSNRKSDFTIDNETGHEIEILTYHEYPKVFNTIKNKTTVFYANGLDLDQRDTETTNYYNISTSYLLNHPGKINYRQKSSNLKRMSSQKRFRYTELRRQAEFLQRLNDFDHDIPFKRQLYIEVEINEVFKKDYDKLLKITLTKLEQTDDLNYEFIERFCQPRP
ncbi:AAA family ATPase [Pedobacter sp. UC225_61]|uniref:AAA family ATPase n=1 Tax=Pedobacter sp. UC225_61 TaxID=3374623 RepID=UPI003794CA33